MAIIKKKHERKEDEKRVVVLPCNNGHHAYLVEDGSTRHLSTNTEDFQISVIKLNAQDQVLEYAARWPESNWPTVAARLS